MEDITISKALVTQCILHLEALCTDFVFHHRYPRRLPSDCRVGLSLHCEWKYAVIGCFPDPITGIFEIFPYLS